ncbi:MAG: hypothetical protein QNK30_05215 [Bacteroidales bacterium]|nr:hypothetical protein [Bacteroidales bacterium]
MFNILKYFLGLGLLILFITLKTSTISSNYKSEKNKSIEIRGIYGSPEPFWKMGYNLNDLGVNAIFVHKNSLNNGIIKQAKAEGLKVYAEFPTLNGKNYLENHPEAWPINEKGERARPASWFMGICPTEPGFHAYRLEELQELLRTLDVDGVWMDYVHWHAQFEEPEPILPETCFCENCLALFQDDSGIELPGGSASEKANWILSKYETEWRSWRCEIISGWVKDFKEVLHKEKPGILLGLYHCPWNDDEFDGARRKILGIDYNMLKEYIDVFSPMVYHGRMERSPEWVKENIEWFSDKLNVQTQNYPKIWPIVQAYDDPDKISAEEFEDVLNFGMAGMSTGIMMFTSYAVSEDPKKIEVMKKVYSELEKIN